MTAWNLEKSKKDRVKRLQVKQLTDIRSVLDFLKRNGRLPHQSLNDANEKRLGVFLSNLKRARSHPEKVWFKLYDTTVEYLKKRDCSWILFSSEERYFEKIKECVEFYKENGRLPRAIGDVREKRLYGFLREFKICEKIKRYPHIIKYLNNEKLLWIMEDGGKKKVDQAQSIVTFYRKNGRLPRVKSENAEEVELYEILNNLRTFRNNPNTNPIKFKTLDDYLNSEGLIWIIFRKKQFQLYQIKEIVNFYAKWSRTPSPLSKDMVERELGVALSKMVNKTVIIHDETMSFLKQSNMTFLLNGEIK